ncbi:MAG: tripartite tricarboxylate transporter substrate-binding protein [Paracoccaceae bacterium]
MQAAVVNKPGGGGGPFPGAIETAAEAADGYTVGSFVMDVPLVGPLIGIPELNPFPFEPLGIFVTYPMVLATPKDAPYDTIEELAAYSQDNSVVVAHFGPELTPTQQTLSLAAKTGGHSPLMLALMPSIAMSSRLAMRMLATPRCPWSCPALMA